MKYLILLLTLSAMSPLKANEFEACQKQTLNYWGNLGTSLINPTQWKENDSVIITMGQNPTLSSKSIGSSAPFRLTFNFKQRKQNSVILNLKRSMLVSDSSEISDSFLLEYSLEHPEKLPILLDMKGNEIPWVGNPTSYTKCVNIKGTKAYFNGQWVVLDYTYAEESAGDWKKFLLWTMPAHSLVKAIRGEALTHRDSSGIYFMVEQSR